jgi:L-ribulose-5-phosphate 3-epimerase
MSIFSICLSAHRRFGLGSARAEVRARAAEILDAAIGLASDLGIRVVQIAGYFAYYENHDQAARARYVDGLRLGLEMAERRGVMLAIENIDTADMASVTDCIALRDEMASPWFQIYPDVGNLALHKLDLASELTLLPGAAVGLHLKDVRPGQPRRVPFGQGDVPFDVVFSSIADGHYAGPLTLEMWNDQSPTAVRAAADALTWIKERMRQAIAGRRCAPAPPKVHTPRPHSVEVSGGPVT